MADNNSQDMALSNSAIIVICILLAGVAVLIGWAIGHRLWQDRGNDVERDESGFTQYEYMRDLRERTKEGIASVNHGLLGRPKMPTRQQSIPLSATDYSSGGPSRY